MPLTFENGTTTPLVAVSIGGGPSLSTVFNTSTAGLRVPVAALAGATYTDTGQPIIVTLENGNGTFTLSGTLGKADVNVGGIDIGKAVPFQIVKQITCSFQPCAVSQFSGSISGIFGVRPWITEDGVLYGLMGELPGNLSSGFIVSLYGSQPSVRVGLTPSITAGFTEYNVPTATLADGSPTWNQSAQGGLLPWCYTVVDGTSTVRPACSAGIMSAAIGRWPDDALRRVSFAAPVCHAAGARAAPGRRAGDRHAGQHRLDTPADRNVWSLQRGQYLVWSEFRAARGLRRDERRNAVFQQRCALRSEGREFRAAPS
jgi:hypothetical protein